MPLIITQRTVGLHLVVADRQVACRMAFIPGKISPPAQWKPTGHGIHSLTSIVMSLGIGPHDIPGFYLLMNPTIGFIQCLLISDLYCREIILSGTQCPHTTIRLICINGSNFEGWMIFLRFWRMVKIPDHPEWRPGVRISQSVELQVRAQFGLDPHALEGQKILYQYARSIFVFSELLSSKIDPLCIFLKFTECELIWEAAFCRVSGSDLLHSPQNDVVFSVPPMCSSLWRQQNVTKP